MLLFFSARLAAAAGVGDHGGLKEEGKKDAITGGRRSHTAVIHDCTKSNGLRSLIFFPLVDHDFFQIVWIQRERQNPKNRKGMLPRRRKKRGRKMKNRKRNPRLVLRLKAALPQVQSLKGKEVKRLLVVNALQLQCLNSKNRYPDWFRKANEGKRRHFPSLSRNLNCPESKKKRRQIWMCPPLRHRAVTLVNPRRI